MRAQCRPGASGQREDFTATCNSSCSAAGDLGHKVAWGEIHPLYSKGSIPQQKGRIFCLLSFVGGPGN